MAETFIFDVILCGWANDQTRNICDRVMLALNRQTPVCTEFNQENKAPTIRSIWDGRLSYFNQVAPQLDQLPFYRWSTSRVRRAQLTRNWSAGFPTRASHIARPSGEPPHGARLGRERRQVRSLLKTYRMSVG